MDKPKKDGACYTRAIFFAFASSKTSRNLLYCKCERIGILTATEDALPMDYQAFLAAIEPFRADIIILAEEPMSRHTTFRIGGAADIFLKPQTVDALGAVMRAAHETGVPSAIIGNGSNLLVRDEGYPGVAICTGDIRGITRDGDTITAGAGALLSQVARTALDASLTGFEFAAGIPGTLGGAVFMNAGAYGGEMKDVLAEVLYLDESGARHTVPVAQLELGYRTSIFKTHPEWTVAGAMLRLQKGDSAAIRARMDELAFKRRDKQPLELPSAGSTFKRPEGYFAGKLIEEAGLRGFAIGGAQVSEKHCGFVVNRGGATCADVLGLIAAVQEKVKTQFGVTLEPEVRLL